MQPGPFNYSNKKLYDSISAKMREIEEKKANKDYDGDGKVESGTAEWRGSRDKAIKAAIARRTRSEEVEQVDEIVTRSRTHTPMRDVGSGDHHVVAGSGSKGEPLYVSRRSGASGITVTSDRNKATKFSKDEAEKFAGQKKGRRAVKIGEAVNPAMRAGIDYKPATPSDAQKKIMKRESEKAAKMRSTPDTSAAGRAAQRMIDARKATQAGLKAKQQNQESVEMEEGAEYRAQHFGGMKAVHNSPSFKRYQAQLKAEREARARAAAAANQAKQQKQESVEVDEGKLVDRVMRKRKEMKNKGTIPGSEGY